MTTHKRKLMMSRGGISVRKGGLNIKDPLALPTSTVWTLPVREAGVGAGEPGYDAYVVTHEDASTVTVTVTVDSTGAAGIVAVS